MISCVSGTMSVCIVKRRKATPLVNRQGEADVLFLTVEFHVALTTHDRL